MLFCTEEYIKHNFRQMKYHSPISIIIISLIVLLLFVSVAFFAVFSIGLTSPTLIVTERLMSSLEKADSNLSFSFDSMERNLRGGFTINNLEVGYKDESVVSLERLRVHMGIPALLRYLVLGDGNLEIEGINGSISIPDITGSGESSGESGFSIPEFSRSISLHLHNIDMLRDGIGLRAYGQKDPLIEYKREAYDLFNKMMYEIQADTVKHLFRTKFGIQVMNGPTEDMA